METTDFSSHRTYQSLERNGSTRRRSNKHPQLQLLKITTISMMATTPRVIPAGLLVAELLSSRRVPRPAIRRPTDTLDRLLRQDAINGALPAEPPRIATRPLLRILRSTLQRLHQKHQYATTLLGVTE